MDEQDRFRYGDRYQLFGLIFYDRTTQTPWIVIDNYDPTQWTNALPAKKVQNKQIVKELKTISLDPQESSAPDNREPTDRGPSFRDDHSLQGSPLVHQKDVPEREQDLIDVLLHNDGLEDDRSTRDAILMALESVQTLDSDIRPRVKERLLRHAEQILQERYAGYEVPLSAALRRAASMVEEASELSSFQRFLDPSCALSVKQVVLQSIQNVFERHPPSDAETRPLHARVGELMRKFLDPDLMTDGSHAAFAVNALAAGAVLNHPELLDCTDRLLGMHRPAVTRNARRLLSVVVDNWENVLGDDAAQHQGLGRVREALARIESQSE